MGNRFLAQVKEFCRKMRVRINVVLPSIVKTAASMVKGAPNIILPCAGALILFELIKSISGGASALVELIGLLLVVPAAAAVIAYAADAVWENRVVTPTDAVNLVRIRFKQIFITGAAAWLIVMAARSIMSMLMMLVLMLLGSIFALLSMIPIIGVVFAAIGAVSSWLAALLVEYASHIALMIGMMAFIADGISGKAQLDRAFAFMKNGGKRLWEALILLFGVWVVIGGAGALLSLLSPALGAAVRALLTACSMAALCVIYLRERSGVSFC